MDERMFATEGSTERPAAREARPDIFLNNRRNNHRRIKKDSFLYKVNFDHLQFDHMQFYFFNDDGSKSG